jgi:hypothetical protein
MATFPRNKWQDSPGMGGRFGPEYSSIVCNPVNWLLVGYAFFIHYMIIIAEAYLY